MAVDVGTAVAYLDLNMTAFNQGLQQAQSALQTLKDSTSTVGDKLSSVGGMISNVGTSLTRNLTVPIVDFGQSALGSFTEFEKAITGIRKTVDDRELTKRFGLDPDNADDVGKAYEILGNKIQDMAVRTGVSAIELARIGEISGQLGVAIGDNAEILLNFIETMAKLGVTTDLSSDEAAVALAQFINISDATQGNVDKLGAAIVDLGNNFATQEPEIVYMSQRLASAGTIAGLTSQEILALSTAIASAGIKTEAGASSMSTTITQISRIVELAGTAADDTGEYMSKLNTLAQIGGVSAEEFARLWRTHPVEALQAFFVGLGNVNTEGESMIQFLDDLGMTSIRQSNLVRALALSSENLSRAVQTANTAFEENTAMETEWNKYASTTDQQLKMLKEDWETIRVEIGEMLLPVLRNLMDMVKSLINWWKSLSDETKQLIIRAAEITAVVGPIILIVGKLMTSVGALIKVIEIIKGIGIISKVKEASEVFKITNLVLGDMVDNSSMANLAVGQLNGAFNLTTDSAAIATQSMGNVAVSAEQVAVNTGNAGSAIQSAGAAAEGATPKATGFAGALQNIAGFALTGIGVTGVIYEIVDAVKNGADIVHGVVAALFGAIAGIGVALLAGASLVVGGVVGAIVGAVAILIVWIVQHWDEVKEYFVKFGNFLKEVFEKAWEAVVWIWDHSIGAIIKFCQNLWNKLFGDPIIVDICEALVKWFKDAWDFVVNIFKTAIDSVIAIVTFLKDTIGGLIKAAVDGIVERFEAVRDGIINVVNSIKEKISEFGSAITEKFNEVRNSISEFFDGLISMLSSWKEKWISNIKDIASSFVEGFKSGIGNVKEFFTNIFNEALESISKFTSKFFDAGKNIMTKLWDGIKSIWDNITSWVSEKFNSLVESITKIFNPVKNLFGGISDFFSGVTSKISGSHQNGLDYVPYDGYIAELHKGEKVLTKEEAKGYNNNKGIGTINFYSDKKIDEYEAARLLKRTVKEIDLGLV